MVLRPIIAVCLLLGCASNFVRGQQKSPPPAVSDPSSIGQQLDRLDSLEAREAEELKQRLLTQLYRRIQTVTKITLRDRTPYERLQQQEQALQPPDHRQFTSEQIRQLWQEVDRLEQAVVDHLARQYRIAIYNTFRTQRSVYDVRLYAWRRVERTWQKVGQSVDDRPQMIRWLDEAIAVSRAGKVTKLPSVPDFLASRTERWIDVPQGANPLDDPPDPNLRAEDSGVRIVRSPQRVTPSVLPADRSEDNAPLPPIVHAEPPLLRKLPPARMVESPVEEDLSVAITRRRPSPPTDAQAADRSPGDQPHDPVRVNLAEIEARVAGYGLALATLRERLEQPGPWTADRLAPLIETLDELATRRGDLRLYHRLVPREYQQQLSAMASPAATAALLARRIVQARSQRSLDAVRLDEFSQRITEILRP